MKPWPLESAIALHRTSHEPVWRLQLVCVDDRDRFALRVCWIATCGSERVHVVALTTGTGLVLDVQATSDVLRYSSGTGSRDLDALIARRTSAFVTSSRAVGEVQRWHARRRRRWAA